MSPGGTLCTICGADEPFLNPERGREGFQCRNCSASSRNRAVMLALGRVLGYDDRPLHRWPAHPELRLLESSARGPHAMFLGEKYTFVAPEYDPGQVLAGAPPEEYADLEQLGFPEESFHVVLSSDVFEHVRQDERGFREVYRVLKPGGMLILTVPYHHDRPETEVRVKVDGELDVHLMEARYHGGGGATLQYRTYGRDLLSRLRATGFTVAHWAAERAEYGIAPESVILAQKGPWFELESHWMTAAPVTPERAGSLWLYRLFTWWKWNRASAQQFGQMARRKVK